MTRSQQAALLASLLLLIEDCSCSPLICVDMLLADAAIEEVRRESHLG